MIMFNGTPSEASDSALSDTSASVLKGSSASVISIIDTPKERERQRFYILFNLKRRTSGEVHVEGRSCRRTAGTLMNMARLTNQSSEISRLYSIGRRVEQTSHQLEHRSNSKNHPVIEKRTVHVACEHGAVREECVEHVCPGFLRGTSLHRGWRVPKPI